MPQIFFCSDDGIVAILIPSLANIVCRISILWLTPMGKDSVHISGQIVNTHLCSWELKEVSSCDDILNASCRIGMRWDQEWPVEGKCWVHKHRAGAAGSALIDPLVRLTPTLQLQGE